MSGRPRQPAPTAAEELRELTREAHAAAKDLRAAIREARAEVDRHMAERLAAEVERVNELLLARAEAVGGQISEMARMLTARWEQVEAAHQAQWEADIAQLRELIRRGSKHPGLLASTMPDDLHPESWPGRIR